MLAVSRQSARGQTLLTKAIHSGSPASSEMPVIGVLSRCSFVVDKIDVVPSMSSKSQYNSHFTF